MKRFLLLALLLCAGCSGPQPKQAETPAKAADPTPPPAAATSGPPSFDTVMKLHDGQTYAEVVAIMGEPKWIAMSSKDDKAATILWWEWPAEHMPTYVDIKLSDGLVAYISIRGIDVPKGKEWGKGSPMIYFTTTRQKCVTDAGFVAPPFGVARLS